MPDPAASALASRQPDRLREWLVLGAAVLVVLALSAASTLMLWRQRADTLQTWQLYMGNFAGTVAEHAGQVAHTADAVLTRVVERVQDEAGESEERLREVAASRRMFDFLETRRLESSGVARDIAIIDLHGQVLVNSQAFPPPHVNVHDRDYFKAHLAQPELQSFLSAPVLSRDTGRWTFFLARKIRARSGHALGLVITGIEVAYFERFYRSVNLDDAHTAIQLLRSDGTPLARHPQRLGVMTRSYHDAPGLRALREAQARGEHGALLFTRAPRPSNPSVSDSRLVAARAVEGLPLAVVAIATEELMLREWRRTAWFVGLGTLVLDAVLAALALWSFTALRRRRRAIERLAAEHDQQAAFLAGISHEIRTPLDGLLARTRRLLQQAPALDAEGQRQELRTMERSAELLLALVDDLLDYSRLETGHLDLARVPFAIAPVAQDCLALFEEPARARGVALELYMGSAAHTTLVLGDPLRLAQIINNLLSNALRFTAAGRVALSIAPLDTQRWRVAVSDTGTGMTAEQRARLFEPLAPPPGGVFRHAGDGAAGPGQGLGLGLSIVRRLALLHGGSVAVDSEPGRGTEVSCELLLPPAPAQAAQAQAAVAEASQPG
ncbi:sensor histidine kinase [Azohydromonas aeria]|uniref:sensor histidine kinase n=1 Tax=Azohydromonas aeria TaxID=2590212 RepID=UPI0012F84DAD|nr:ATP-binding protein [Azohydromonas aeria]